MPDSKDIPTPTFCEETFLVINTVLPIPQSIILILPLFLINLLPTICNVLIFSNKTAPLLLDISAELKKLSKFTFVES